MIVLRLNPTFVIFLMVTAGYITGQLLYLYNPYLLLYLIQFNPLIIYYHFYWELVTSILVTPSFFDYAFNSVALYFIYYLYRGEEGVKEIAIFLLTGVFGNLLYLIVYPNGLPSAGASGGIFGILAYYSLLDYLREKQSGGLIILLGALILSDTLLLPFLNINVLAHIGGTVSGLILALVAYKLSERSTSL
mgnify:CR=1 FL=1